MFIFHQTQNSSKNPSRNWRGKVRRSGRRINLVTIDCGPTNEKTLSVIKSAAIFSQDASLHVIVFSAEDRIISLTEDVSLLFFCIFGGTFQF